MTADEIGRLSIVEVEAIVSRATEALTRFREVQSLLGGNPILTPVEPRTAPPMEDPRVSIRHANPSLERSAMPALTPSEQAIRARLLSAMRPDPAEVDEQ